MSSPQSATSESTEPKKLEQVSFRFCSECSNMLYPKEDERNLKLQFTCRTCQFTEDAKTTCVFRNNLNNSAGETAGVTQDVGSDPTVSDMSHLLCTLCGFVISCNTCGQSDAEMTVREIATPIDTSCKHAPQQSDQHESLADIIASLDPFYDDYDEDMMFSEPDYSHGSETTIESPIEGEISSQHTFKA
jgi:DNA-directed RNA polymerase II subunit RPB9